MKRGDLVIILQNSGPWDNEEFYGRVGEYSYTDYGSIAVAVDGKMVLCEPENIVMVSVVPFLLEVLGDALDWLSRFSEHAPVSFGGEVELGFRIQAALAAARGTDGNQ